MQDSLLKLKASINHIYASIRKYITWSLIATILIAEIYGIGWLQIASIFTLLLINNELLFNIDEKIHALKKPKSYYRFSDACNDIKKIIDKESNWNKGPQIKYIGMTLTNVFDTFEDILNHLKDKGAKDVSFEIAMLDPEFLKTGKPIRKDWTSNRSLENFERFERLKDRYNKEISGLNWLLSVKKYNHMPCIHGMLINEHHLFLGIARWEDNFQMFAGDRTFTYFRKNFAVYESGEINLDNDFIKVFEGWFKFNSAKYDI